MPPKRSGLTKNNSSNIASTTLLSSGKRRTRSEASNDETETESSTTSGSDDDALSTSSSSCDETESSSSTSSNHQGKLKDTQTLVFTQKQSPLVTKNSNTIIVKEEANIHSKANTVKKNSNSNNNSNSHDVSNNLQSLAVPSNKITSQNADIVPGLIAKIPILVGSVAIPIDFCTNDDNNNFATCNKSDREGDDALSSNKTLMNDHNRRRVPTSAVNLTRLQHQHRATHEWICFVEEQIFGSNPQNRNSVIQAVEFRMHASFGKQAIERVSSPPFCIKRQGWDDVRIVIIIHLKASSNEDGTASASATAAGGVKAEGGKDSASSSTSAAVMIQHTVRLQTPLWHIPQLRLLSHQQQQKQHQNAKEQKSSSTGTKTLLQKKQLAAHNPSALLDLEACWPAPQTNLAKVAPEWSFLADCRYPCVVEFLDELVIRCPLRSQVELLARRSDDEKNNNNNSTYPIKKEEIGNDDGENSEDELENILSSTSKKKQQQQPSRGGSAVLPIHAATQPLPVASPFASSLSVAAKNATQNNNRERDFLLYSSASPFTIQETKFWLAYKDFRHKVREAISATSAKNMKHNSSSSSPFFSSPELPIEIRGPATLGFLGHGAAMNAMNQKSQVNSNFNHVKQGINDAEGDSDEAKKKKNHKVEDDDDDVPLSNMDEGRTLLVAAPGLMLSQQGIDSACAALDVVIARALNDLANCQRALVNAHEEQQHTQMKVTEMIFETKRKIERNHQDHQRREGQN